MTLTYKNIPIQFNDLGEGDAIVLLHGFLENSTMWKDLIPQISRNHRIIAIDLLGHGKTGCLGYIHTMEMMAEAVEAVLGYLKVEKVKFIGHSMGGYVALAFAESYRDKVQGLCLLNSTAMADGEERKLNRDRAIAAVKQNHKAFISMSVSNLFAPQNRERLLNEIEQVKQEALKMPVQGIIAALEGMKIRNDRTKLFREIEIDKLLVVGLKDPVLETDSVLKQAQGTTIEILELSGGHMSHIENSNELTYKIIHFVEK